MALKAVTTLDIPGLTQIIVFNNPSVVDEYDFGSNQVTLKAISTFNLSKSDFLLYTNYLNIYYTALLLNFPTLNAISLSALPLSEYDFKIGSTRITYDQHSGVNDALNLTYILSTSTMTFAARASDVTITIQEFYMMIYFLKQVSNQIFLN